MSVKFSQLARKIAERYTSAQAIDAAIAHLGARAEQAIDGLDTEHKLMIAGQFVRGLHEVAVADATRLEHELFAALDAAPTARRAVVVKDAISLITVRNHVHQVTTAVGMPWNEGMQVQSAISDVARHLSQHGGGRIETEALPGGAIRFDIHTSRPLGPLSVEFPAQTPAWLVAVAHLTRNFQARHDHGGTHLAFTIDMRAAAAA